ncbi:hypothetical protein [uncultured Pseudonocardia sp.]|uniref:hypothetical protein n=1 Tax=uncultured Pseudonocardia sp. TaxID=211455 RepID=UPI00260E4462|nr:hypothetical protein [uncultured Pseudonocardia sp.]
MSVVVFVADSDHPGSKGGRLQPAYRAWSDALLVRRARNADEKKVAALTMRATAQIARAEPISPYGSSVDIAPESCLIAKSSDLMRLYFPPTWTDVLLGHLVDTGFSRAACEELIMPCDDPWVLIDATKMAAVLLETPADLLGAIEDFFCDEIDEYVDSLSDLHLGSIPSEDFEILVPCKT